jgi:hypothetical protein
MSDIIDASNHIKLRLTGLKEATNTATSIYSSQTNYKPNFVLIQSKGGSQNFISDFLPT